jgi:hypothetical protein
MNVITYSHVPTEVSNALEAAIRVVFTRNLPPNIEWLEATSDGEDWLVQTRREVPGKPTGRVRPPHPLKGTHGQTFRVTPAGDVTVEQGR